eukprot:1609444-Amphidinium_carterae.1
MAVLHLLGSLRSRSFKFNLIARELAMELAQGSFRPDRLEHVPGLPNSLADAASRQFDPVPASLPDALRRAEQVVAPARTAEYYRYSSAVSDKRGSGDCCIA